MRPKDSTAEASPSGGQAMAAQPCWPCRRKGARKGGGEAEFQVGFGAELGQVPLGELAAQKQAETLAEDQPAAAAAHVGAGAAAEIEQKKLAFAPREALDGEFQAGGGGLVDAGDAAGQVAGAVPGLQREAVAAEIEREVIGVRASSSSPGSSSAGWRDCLRKASISVRVCGALRPAARGTESMEMAL